MIGRHFVGVALAGAVLAVTACSSSANPLDPNASPLCCTEFKVGATIDASIGGSAQSQVAVQTIADIGAIGASAVADLTTACRNIAKDLGAPADKTAALADKTGSDAMKGWCDLAVTQITSFKGSATLTINVTPPVCSASISAQADCQAKCDVSGKCDIKANPPKCTGGKLEVSCKGSCSGDASVGVSCTGSCDGSCQGGCTVQGGIECTGKCEGTCEAGGSAGGTGAQADGTCKGICKGTCSATPPSVTCTGSCNGTCKGTCSAKGDVAVKCDGTCTGDAEPISCEGGKLEGGCQVDAKCQGNCNASASAKATCTPAQVDISFSAEVDDKLGALEATLKANLPLILGIKAKLAISGDAVVSLKGNIDAVTDIKLACIPLLGAATLQAASDFADSLTVTASIATSVGVQ